MKMAKKMRKADSATLATLARRLGISPQALSQGIKAGRLLESVEWVDGRPRIRDLDAAVLEWRATRQRFRPEETAEGIAQRNTLRAVVARKEHAKAALLEREVAEREASLVVAAEVGPMFAAYAGRCRTRILDIVRRARER